MPGTLETLLAFDDQFQRDQQQTPAFLHRRDRRYALDHDDQPWSYQHWLQRQQSFAGQHGAGKTDSRLVLWQRIRHLFLLAGAVLGALTMSGMLFYDGGQQINVTVILGVVALQLMLALLTATQGLAGWQPWRLLSSWLQNRARAAASSPLAPLKPQLMTLNAQAGGLAFAVAGLVTLLFSVVIQDLAFGWSTTLDTAVGSYHRLVSAVASPWAGWLPAAAPTPELVADTRFYRLGDASASPDPGRWGAWWPFIAMTWLSYVVLPRALLLTLARWHLHVKSRRTLAEHPGMAALQWRMESPLLETGANTPDSGVVPDHETGKTRPLPASRLAVRWAGAGDEAQLHTLVESPAVLVAAGGRQRLADDQQALAHLARERSSADRALVVIARGWEPPTAELADFLEETRAALPGLQLALLPLGQAPGQPLNAFQQAQWQRLIGRTGVSDLILCHAPSADVPPPASGDNSGNRETDTYDR
ncbi:DUF2868 domain-containing protein [uncultured Marinobacter sp.]|uniref:DUF2868 domain-containing protein n=1 Tax=uncultured Marinobacter sp. TaxID=187379 RepID=UPI0030DC6EB3